MVIRHAEKPKGQTDGVDENGHRDKESLTVAGWVRAGALIGAFGADGNAPHRGLAVPQRIVAASGESSSRRPLDTVVPLGRRMGIEPITRFGKDDVVAAADYVRAQPGVTLMSWEHKRIADLVNAFGTVHPAPDPWPDNRFDIVMVIRSEGRSWSLDYVAQMLLAGDRPIT